ncbi:hypothetical protein SERLA73DRAFT_98341 [Serpula lacrymans var. lacrymans S7.3]|uniref:DH domain-containing protein n=1 Tax=Serpula lacrymans var. lacrymans (strain S7.3) TaxID=936435 RepID=F8QF64_SERL3|nr:hypothetical protein SERLA73DRAFT_98341 [Serpula lacrymans var. lacrymans S7.3]
MALSTSPRKVIPLSSGDDNTPRKISSATVVTKRVFFCGVVVEGCENGRRLPEDIQELVLSLGDPLGSPNDNDILPSASDASFSDFSNPDGVHQRKRAMTNTSALADVINELVSTERSYVRRLRILKSEYADPLRSFSRSKSTAILPPYEAKTLFGNIDNLLPVNETFLTDLEKMLAPNGAKTVGGVGDVALRHFKDLRGFEHYKQYYIKREEAQSIFEREVMKKSSGFAAFIDRIKYSTADTRNRVGLRELLMDPVQRIPRYTLLFRMMIKHMAPEDPQRAKLTEAEEIASVIALAETDEQTKRAAIMYCLSATVEGFPPALVSNSRRFIDCIDAEDVFVDTPGPSVSASSSSLSSLHCTLFLFDDKLMIVKRPGGGEKSGRALAGLDELDKLTKAGGLPLGKKKSGMSCKGVVDLSEIVVADVGDSDFHIYLENPPQDQSDRWSARSFRALSVVFPPSPVNMDPTRTTTEKSRFLENLWIAQAKYRTKTGQSVVLCADDREVESRGGRTTYARTYFNVYQRTAFLQETKKTKIVVHIDPQGTADPMPFGMNGPPFVVIRVQPMAGEISRYTVTSGYPNDEPEEDIVQTARVPGRIIQTIHQFGLFKFRTGNDSRPSTPTASTRSRAHIFSLDALSRNLFNAIPGSSKGDFFGGSVNHHRRTKSTTSRSSTYTQTTTTADGSLAKFSHRSNSTATAATSMLSMDDESYVGSRSSTRRKLVKRGRSPSSDPERRSSGHESNPSSRSPSRERTTLYNNTEENNSMLQKNEHLDPSDRDLSMRLELARKNSQNQHGKDLVPMSLEQPVEETIYEEGPPQAQVLRPASRASYTRETMSQRSTTPRPDSVTPTRGMDYIQPSRSDSQLSSDNRRFGPRSPSPLPPKSPVMSSDAKDLPSMDVDLALESALGLPGITGDTPSPLPRSKRQPFLSVNNTDIGSTPAANAVSTLPNSVEPLSIKKKTSTRSAHPSFTPTRKAYMRTSPLSKATARVVSPRRISPQFRTSRVASGSNNIHPVTSEHADQVLQLFQVTKEDVDSSHRAVKRIKLELDELRSSSQSGGSAEYWRSPSPEKGIVRTPGRNNVPMTKEAQQRMEEMRQLIGKRQPEGTPRSRPRSIVQDSIMPRTPDPSFGDNFAYVNESASDADKSLARAVQNNESLHNDLLQLVTDFKERISDLDKTRVELLNTKRQCELVKSLLADATAEKEIMYEAFNEELDAMYNDVNLPEDEAWTNMTTDLRQTKETRNALSRENSQLKRRLAEIESEKEEWGALLKAHGLIP